MVGRRAIERVLILWLLTGLVAVGLQAQDIFLDGFETGDSCLWNLSVTPDVCDGKDNDCDREFDEDAACNDEIACTQDSCGATGCEFWIDAAWCLIDGQCFDVGSMNPSNSCQVCDASESQIEWTVVSDGTACGDEVCDECNGGVCVNSANGNPGPGCTDTTTTGCDNPDTCSFGSCQDNNLASGTACGGAMTEPICDPDTCNGNGTCIDNAPASDSTPCGGLECEECNVGVCVTVSTCGDGVVCAASETCDDGYTDACGTCNATCSGSGSGSTCGDGVVCAESEACDDGDTDDCGTCNATCTGPGTGPCT